MAISKESVIVDKSFDFAERIVKLYKYLINEKKEYILSKQILRCGTSIGANVSEAHGSISTSDFSNKISIAYKETKETDYWLRLLHRTNYINDKMFNSLLNDIDELSKILFSIIKTTRLKNK